jgi:hypothetical protein
MVTISKPLSASQATAYHANEFASAEQSYYTLGNQIRGEWQGKLAQQWGLTGEVSAEQFTRLAQGQHSETGEQLVKYQQPREYINDAGAETAPAVWNSGIPQLWSCGPTSLLNCGVPQFRIDSRRNQNLFRSSWIFRSRSSETSSRSDRSDHFAPTRPNISSEAAEGRGVYSG